MLVRVSLRRPVRQRLARRRADPVGRARLEHPGLRAHPVGGAASLHAGRDTTERPQAQRDVHPAPDHQRHGEGMDEGMDEWMEAGLKGHSGNFEIEMS